MAQRLEAITDDGVRLWAATDGPAGAPGLVLCHGGPGLWDYLEPFAVLLAGTARGIRYDQRGCGRSGGAAGPYTLERFVEDIDAVRRAAGFERWIAGGHSWGATLALHYALAHPDRVEGLLYVSGVGLDWTRPTTPAAMRSSRSAPRQRGSSVRETTTRANPR
ncbi:MAG TPA: alpha/beta fold hydrolase [Candidatus Limnocylindria bacterium]